MGDGVLNFAALLQRHRQAAGLSQEELAERAGLSRRGISDLERGVRRLPHPVTVRRLAAALHLRHAEQATLLAALGRKNPAGHDTPVSGAPVSLTSFVGREHEVAEVQRLLGGRRLVSLTGAGGIGKTRLALEVARAIADGGDHIVFVELASVSDASLVLGAVAAGLGIHEQAGRPLFDVVVESLQHRRLLLVLDNCEHLVQACAELAELLLGSCAGLRILATSRERLGAAGETNWRVPSLVVPDPDTPSDALHEFEAARLFLERASAVSSSFSLTAQNGPPVATLCRRLDGIPLAIELAAARVTILSVEQIVARLDHTVRLLGGGSRTAPARQRTLQATFEWSYGLLSQPEQLLLARSSVFVAGWTLEAAEAVCSDDAVHDPSLGTRGVDRGRILDLLGSLVDKSLVLVEPGADCALRYRLLEPLRQFAAERLADRGEAARLQGRHARWFADLAAEAASHYHGRGQTAALERVQAEHANVLAALDWLLQRKDVEAAARVANALLWFWTRRDHWQEARTWLERLAAASDSGTAVTTRSELYFALGQVAWLQGDFPAAATWADKSLEGARQHGHAGALAPALALAGRLASVRGEHGTARQLFEEGLACVRGEKQGWSEPPLLGGLAMIALEEGDLSAAKTQLESSVALARAAGDDWHLANALNSLGDVARRVGDYSLAKQFYQESLGLHEAMARETRASVLHNIGYVSIHEGNLTGAAEHFGASLRLFQRRGERRGVAECLVGLACVLAAAGEARLAARLFGAAEATFEVLQTRLSASNRADYERGLALARGGLDPAAFFAAWSGGRRLSLNDAVCEALETPW